MATGDLISRSALLEEYDRVHIGPPGGARKLIEGAKCVREMDLRLMDAITVDRTMRRTILRLLDHYERARNSDFVRKPLAYAVYQLLREIEREETENDKK